VCYCPISLSFFPLRAIDSRSFSRKTSLCLRAEYAVAFNFSSWPTHSLLLILPGDLSLALLVCYLAFPLPLGPPGTLPSGIDGATPCVVDRPFSPLFFILFPPFHFFNQALSSFTLGLKHFTLFFTPRGAQSRGHCVSSNAIGPLFPPRIFLHSC